MALKKTGILSTAIAFCVMATAARATITVSQVRSPNANLAGYDTVWFFALNDRTGADTGNTNIVGVGMTITDHTKAGLLGGIFVNDTASPYQGDPAGEWMGINDSNGPFQDAVPGYNTIGYPQPPSNTPAAFSLYSWVGNGRFNQSNFLITSSTPDHNVQSTTIAGTGYGTLLSSLSVMAGWGSGGISASAATGGVSGKSQTLQTNFGNAGLDFAGRGALIGVAVVMHADFVEATGVVYGANMGSSQTFDSIPPVPESSSMGLLGIGALLFLKRRRANA